MERYRAKHDDLGLSGRLHQLKEEQCFQDGVEPEDMGFILKGVKKRRCELGMTQLDLMAKAQLSGPTISKAEGGRRVSYETVARIAYALGVKFDEIVKEFYGEDEEVCDESTGEHQNT